MLADEKLSNRAAWITIGCTIALCATLGFFLRLTMDRPGAIPQWVFLLAIVAAVILLYFAVNFFRVNNSRGKLLGFAVLLQWSGVAVLMLPGFDIQVGSKVIPLLDPIKALEVAAAFFGLTSTIWISVGAWLTAADRHAIDHVDKPTKKITLLTSMITGAHQQIAMGLISAILGMAMIVASVALTIYRSLHPALPG